MKLRKPLVILGLVGVVAALAVVGTAFAQTPPSDQQAKTNYQQFFLDRLANALGVTTDKLNSAFTQARNETVDQEVKDGKLTQERADQIKSKQGTVPFGFGFRGFEGGRDRHAGFAGPKGFMGGTQVRDAIAKALGMTSDDLTNQLRSGKKLADLAKGKEDAVKSAIVDAMKPQLDQAVKDGKLTQDQENQILDRIQKSDLNSFGGHWGMGRNWQKGPNKGQTPAPRGNSSTPTPSS